MDESMTLGVRQREVRREHSGMSQERLAAALEGTHQSTLSKIERGVILPSERYLGRIAAALGVPVKLLLEGRS